MGNIEKKERKNTHIYLVGCMGYIEYFHGLRQQGNFPRLFFVLTFFFILYTVPTTKSLHTKSLHFAIFWEIFENFQLKTLLNSKILRDSYRFFSTFIVTTYLVVGTVYDCLNV